MLKIVDANGVLLMPYFVGLCVSLVVLVYCFLAATILAAKKGFEGFSSDMQLGSFAPGKMGLQTEIARSGRSDRDMASVDRFLGRPEAPVFYEIGDTELVRSDRKKEGVDKFEGLDSTRWMDKFEGLDAEEVLSGSLRGR